MDSETFTKREIEILQLIVKGHTSKEIAEKLCLSLSTVENHRCNMIKKAGVKNIYAVIMFAIKNQLIK